VGTPNAQPHDEPREHATVRARLSPSGIGAAVVESTVDAHRREHRWSCVVTDGREHRYIRVIAPGLGPFERLAPVVVEEALERFADRHPSHDRLRGLVNASPVHLDRDGQAYD
jgi:hypothetical protein